MKNFVLLKTKEGYSIEPFSKEEMKAMVHMIKGACLEDRRTFYNLLVRLETALEKGGLE